MADHNDANPLNTRNSSTVPQPARQENVKRLEGSRRGRLASTFIESPLGRLLKVLRPEHSIDPWHRRADEALCSIHLSAVTIRDWFHFIDLMVWVYWVIEQYMLGLPEPNCNAADLAWEHCRSSLRKIHGPEGDKVAFDLARTGVQGGLREVIRALAHQIATEYAENHIAIAADGFWNSLSVDGRLTAGDEFLRLCQGTLPKTWLDEWAPRVHAYLPKYLKEYPRAIERLQQLPKP